MIVLLLTIILTIAVFIRKKSNTIVYLPVFLGIFSSLIFLLLEAELNITGGIFSNSILIIFIF